MSRVMAERWPQTARLKIQQLEAKAKNQALQIASLKQIVKDVRDHNYLLKSALSSQTKIDAREG